VRTEKVHSTHVGCDTCNDGASFPIALVPACWLRAKLQ